MIVKVGDSLGETFGNFVGRLAATLAVLTPVIPAFRASILVVHPVLPDRDHAAMLTMVKDGSWFGLAHRHPSSMAFYRARPGADTLKQDELPAAAGQCLERWRRPWVVRRWMRRQPWSGFTGVPGIPSLFHRSLCRKQWRLCHLDAGTRIIVADSIRKLEQDDRAAVMPNRNPRTNDFT